MSVSPDDDVRRTWTFLTNHAHALVCIARDPSTRIQDIADSVGITLRAAQSIVGDLADAGYIGRERVGRRNRYEVNTQLLLRHPLEQDSQVGDLLHAVGTPKATGARYGRASTAPR